MHLRYVSAALGIASLALLCLTPDSAQGHGRRYHGPVYSAPAPVVYYQPCPPVYHAPPMSPAPGSPAKPRTVTVGAYDKRGFDPKEINVAPGTTVRWVNYGQERHTVTSRDGLFDSGPMSPGSTYSVTFQRPGTYRYFCRPHEKMGMVGTVVVGSGGNGGSGSGSGGSGY
jgi:plastocyanin